MGLLRHMDYMEIIDVSGGQPQGMTTPMYVYDKAHATLRLFHPGGDGGVDVKDATEYAVTDIPPVTTIMIVAVGI